MRGPCLFTGRNPERDILKQAQSLLEEQYVQIYIYIYIKYSLFRAEAKQKYPPKEEYVSPL